jgi:peptidoglycan lytic transglycosylase G
LKRYGSFFLLALLILATILWDSFYRFLVPPPLKNPAVQIVQILPGMSLHTIAHRLTKKRIIQDPHKFMLLTWWKGLDKKIQWGDFELYEGMPPGILLDYLTTGKTMLKRIVIPEGFTLQQIAKRLSEENLATENAFLTSANNPQFIEALGIEGRSLEGYLFPDTYVFHRGMSVQSIQTRMVQRFEEVFNSLKIDDGIMDNFSLRKIVTLASIVEKESSLSSERPLIAAVYYNRLKKGMALQSDPTVIYGIKDFNGDLTKKDLLTPTAYNTYLKPGLPPGPIANPGKDALQAVLSPAQSDFLYFVSKKDGSHYFSKNLLDHNRAVVKYQLSGRVNRKSAVR